MVGLVVDGMVKELCHEVAMLLAIPSLHLEDH